MWFQTKIKLLSDGAVNLHCFSVVTDRILVFVQLIKSFRRAVREEKELKAYKTAMVSLKRNHTTHICKIAFPETLQWCDEFFYII